MLRSEGGRESDPTSRYITAAAGKHTPAHPAHARARRAAVTRSMVTSRWMFTLELKCLHLVAMLKVASPNWNMDSITCYPYIFVFFHHRYLQVSFSPTNLEVNKGSII